MDRISSPEQLEDYMRVTNPGVWMVLAAVIVLLAGILAASVFGRLETTLSARAEIRDKVATVLVSGEKADALRTGMAIRIKDREGKIESLTWVAPDTVSARAAVDLPDGGYEALVVTESLSPIRFLTN